MNAKKTDHSPNPKGTLTDCLGVLASAVCAIHCLCTPLIALCVPALGNFIDTKGFHIAVAGSVTIFGLASCFIGYRKHRSPRIFAAISSGMLIVLTCTFVLQRQISENAEAVWLCIGGGLLIYGHIASLRRQGCC